MTWIKFLFWLAAAYGLYYLFILVIDLLISRRNGGDHADDPVLSFREDILPVRLDRQDNAEFGLGFRLAADQHVALARKLALDVAPLVVA